MTPPRQSSLLLESDALSPYSLQQIYGDGGAVGAIADSPEVVITDYYLSSSDFNGLSLDRLLTSEQPAVLESLRLATSGSGTVPNT
jgi:hypothetical protein